MAGISTEVDSDTGLPLLRKKVAETRQFTATLNQYMASGAKITSIVGVTATSLLRVSGTSSPHDMTVGTAEHTDTVVRFLTTGGVDGETYQVDIDFLDDAGEQLVASCAVATVA